jgi:hypothetical protein
MSIQPNNNEFAIVATRTLDVDGEPTFIIDIGLPYEEPDGTWFCPYRLCGPKTRHQGRFPGVDGVQALLNVLYVLSAEAEASLENLEGRLTWGGQRKHFGFPNHSADPQLHP